MFEVRRLFDPLRHNVARVVIPLVAILIVLGAFALTPARQAQAATCGGSMVYETGWYNWTHAGIAVSYYNPRGLNTIPNLISFKVKNAWGNWITVPNAQYGIDYANPLARLGSSGFIYGVSKSWITANVPVTWGLPSNWRVYYNC